MPDVRTSLFRIAIASIVLAPLAASAAEPSLDQLSWMTGCWRSVGEEAGSGEHWTPIAGGTLLGMSRTVRGGKTTASEFMRISDAPDGKVTFFAQPSGKPSATFTSIKLSATEVVFENLEHDFPQRVIYRLEAPGRIQASIEGTRGGVMRTIPYPLERADCPV
jgi:hypothetical protein